MGTLTTALCQPKQINVCDDSSFSCDSGCSGKAETLYVDDVANLVYRTTDDVCSQDSEWLIRKRQCGSVASSIVGSASETGGVISLVSANWTPTEPGWYDVQLVLNGRTKRFPVKRVLVQ